MAKILLVEDDNNLREIYEARLQAEGYEIVSAPDGEAALVVAKKELPDLVISDVMMPRISGFEMLDILRNTEGLKHVKVIMLTALGQAEDKSRADKLGADKYLVKSQVTLEDIVNSAAELLGTAPAPSTPSTAAAAAETSVVASSAPAAMPMAAAAAPLSVSAPVAPAPEPPSAPTFTPVTPVSEPQATPTMTPVTASPAGPTDASAAAPAPDPVGGGTIVANAVQDLIDGTPGAGAAPSTPAPAAPDPAPPEPISPQPASMATPSEPAEASVPVPPPAPVLPVPPPAAPDAPENTPPAAGQEDSRTKKIIQPLAPNSTAPLAPNLHELMAKEGHDLEAAASQDTPMPHQPGHVISPNPMGPTGQPEDPNKISL